MSDFSTNLQLPYLMPAQAQKHVTVNEALRLLDALCQANAVSMSTAVQPASPADGALYIVPAGKSGADWADAGNWSLGLYADGAWSFVTPREGWLVWVKDAAQLMRWTGAAWVQVDVVTLDTVLAALGNGGALADPGADSILFWDDSAGGFRHLAPSGNLAIGGTTLDVGANVLLESECASAAAVKAMNQSVASTGAPSFAGLNITNSGGTGGTAAYFEHAGSGTPVQAAFAAHAAFSTSIIQTGAAAAAGFTHLIGYSANYADVDFRIGVLDAEIDGAWSGGGADYAEYFEWDDGNPGGEDRRGLSVVLASGAGGRIRPATAADGAADILGVVSANPTLIGDAAWNKWSGKYLRDAFGAYLHESYDVAEWLEQSPDGGAPTPRSCALDAPPPGVSVPHDAAITTQQRRVLNPAYDPQLPYVPRADRIEWDAIGLVGKLRLRTGQPVGERWLKLRDIDAQVQEWLVR